MHRLRDRFGARYNTGHRTVGRLGRLDRFGGSQGEDTFIGATPDELALLGTPLNTAPTATLTDKLLVAGTVTFQCPLMLDFNGLPASTTGTVIVQQASGKTVVNGQGTFNVTCDGQTHINPYAVTPYNAPYKRGGAIAEALFGQYGGFCVYGIFGTQCASGDTGSVPISIGH